MRFHSLVILAVTLFLCDVPGTTAENTKRQAPLPVFFYRNSEAGSSGVDFIARTPAVSAYLSKAGVRLLLHGAALQMTFAGENADVTVEGGSESGGKANFLIGNAPDRWTTNVKLYGSVRYRNLYPGIDMHYGGTDRRLKSEFVVAPGADPSRIRMRYAGFKRIFVDQDGSLLFRFQTGELREDAPEVYQTLNGTRVPVGCKYDLGDDGTVGFMLGAFDKTRELVIDPVLSYSSYLGGSGFDSVTGIAADASGNMYVTGYTDSLDFPIAGAVQGGSGGGVDAFIAKLSPAGNSLIYATYIGGSGDDRARGISIDSSGNAIISGSTTSPNFPRVAAFQTALSGGRDAFVAKLNSVGNLLVFSTYFGGSGSDGANGVAVDSSGNVYVAGETYSTDLPILGPMQAANRGRQEGFAAKFSPAGALQYSTYLGGTGDDRVLAIAVDSTGAAYLSGGTTSPDFPVLSAFQQANAGGQDAFVSKLSPSGASLAYSTYLGGSGGIVGMPEQANGIAVDSVGSAYVTGVTSSQNFPTLGALQTGNAGGGLDAFVTKFDPSGKTLAYSTYIGGIGIDTATSIVLDSAGTAYIAGNTTSPNFPASAAIQSSKAGSMDVFILSITPTGSLLSFSTYFGGNSADSANAIALNGSGNIYIAGQTTSTDFPVLAAFQSVGYSEGNGFILRLNQPAVSNQAPVVTSISPSSGSGTLQTFHIILNDANGNADIRRVDVAFRTAGASGSANSCSVTFDRAGNQLLLLNDNGIGYVGGATPGGSGSVENSQCLLSGPGSAVGASGTTVTLDLTLGFKQAFAGPNPSKTVSTTVYDAAGATGGPSISSWTVPAAVTACWLTCTAAVCYLICL